MYPRSFRCLPEMRVLHLSDVHGDLEKLDRLLEKVGVGNYDLVVVTGDFESVEAVERLADSSERMLAVTGNMDDSEVEEVLRKRGVLLDGEIVEIGKYAFAGIGGRSVYKSVVSVAKRLLSESVGRPLVLVTHYPPAGVKVDLAFARIHIGKGVVRELLEEAKPVLCLCGHVHEARGIDRLGETLLVNPGPLSWGYYAEVDLRELRVELREL